VYWLIVLILGSLTVHTITAMYLCRLPKWTRPCVNLEKEPPTASETMPSDILCSRDAMIQSLVSPTRNRSTSKSDATLKMIEAHTCARVRWHQLVSNRQ